MRTLLTLTGLAALLLTACDVKDPIFNTPHPGHGMVTLTTEWSGIGTGLTPPDNYRVEAIRSGSASAATAGYTATLTGVTNKLDHLFEPADYRFYVHNTPERITLSGTTASVEQVAVTPTDVNAVIFGASPADNPELLIHCSPEWFYTCTLETSIAADTEQTLIAPMQQQVRQLTLLIEPAGETTDKIESITGTLSGVAGTFDMQSGTHGAPSRVPLTFSKITTGADAGKWSVTVRLLGIAGTQQRLTALIVFAGGNPAPIPIDSDLTTQLATFNGAKRTPLTLDVKTMNTPADAGAGATITD